MGQNSFFVHFNLNKMWICAIFALFVNQTLDFLCVKIQIPNFLKIASFLARKFKLVPKIKFLDKNCNFATVCQELFWHKEKWSGTFFFVVQGFDNERKTRRDALEWQLFLLHSSLFFFGFFADSSFCAQKLAFNAEKLQKSQNSEKENCVWNIFRTG